MPLIRKAGKGQLPSALFPLAQVGSDMQPKVVDQKQHSGVALPSTQGTWAVSDQDPVRVPTTISNRVLTILPML